MQKYLLLSLLATILGLLPLHAQDEFDPSKEFTQGDFKYYIWDEENRELSLVDYTGESNSDVIIPEIVSQNDTEYTVKYVVCLGYKAIKSLHISSSVIEVNHDLFSWSPITDQFSVAPDNDVYTSYEGSLYSKDMTKLCAVPRNTVQLIIPEGVVEIEYAACSGSDISSATFPQSLKVIGIDAFSNCHNLSNVTLPSGLEILKDLAFAFSGLSEVTIPAKTIIEDDMFSPFQGCSLTSISVHQDNPNYSSFDGCLYTKDYSTLKLCPSEKESIAFPNATVKEIEKWAFYKCSKLNLINLPSTLEHIGEFAFHRAGITEINIPEGINSIPNDAFSTCIELAKLHLPTTLAEIGENAFASCHKLGTVIIPANVSKMSVSTFDYCSKARILILNKDINIDEDANSNRVSQPTYYADEASGMFHYLKWIMEQYRPNATVKPLPDVFGGMDFFIGPDSEHTGMGWGFALEPASGFQADLTMPAGLSLTDVSLYGAVTDFKKLENGDYRIICYKSDNTVFQDYDNIGLDLKSDETLERGKILFHNIILSIDGTEYSVADKEAGISGYDVRFDNIPESAEEGDTLPLPNPLSKIYDDVSYNWQMHPRELGTITDNNAITFHKAGEVILSAYVSDPNMNTSWSLHMGTITITPALWGDSNSSGAIDLADVVTTVNHILERNPEPFNAKLADVDRNGRINIVDVTSTVKLVLEQPIPDTPESDTQGAPAARELAFSEISRLENGKNILSLNLKPNADYTALQTDLEVPADVAIEAISLGESLSRHTVDYATVAPGVTRVILYSPSLTELAAGEEQPVLNITLGELPANGTIRTLRTLACDAQGQSFTLGNAEKEFYTTTGITTTDTASYNVRAIAGGIEISGSEGAAITVSDLQGRTVATAEGATTATRLSLAPGVYLVSATGQHPAKVLVK